MKIIRIDRTYLNPTMVRLSVIPGHKNEGFSVQMTSIEGREPLATGFKKKEDAHEWIENFFKLAGIEIAEVNNEPKKSETNPENDLRGAGTESPAQPVNDKTTTERTDNNQPSAPGIPKSKKSVQKKRRI